MRKQTLQLFSLFLTTDESTKLLLSGMKSMPRRFYAQKSADKQAVIARKGILIAAPLQVLLIRDL